MSRAIPWASVACVLTITLPIFTSLVVVDVRLVTFDAAPDVGTGFIEENRLAAACESNWTWICPAVERDDGFKYSSSTFALTPIADNFSRICFDTAADMLGSVSVKSKPKPWACFDEVPLWKLSLNAVNLLSPGMSFCNDEARA